MKNFPNFLIVGAAKSGTTSLYYYLKAHPEICMSKVREPWFFAIADIDEEIIKRYYEGMKIVNKLEDYVEQFKDAKEYQIIGEKSVPYLVWYKHTIKNIKKYHPKWRKIKIIAILRNPAQRLLSQYYHLTRNGRETLPIHKIFKEKEKYENFRDIRRTSYWYKDFYFKASMYADALKEYIKNFRYVRVYLYDDLKKDTFSVVKDIFRFLNVDDEFIPPNINLVYNKSTGVSEIFRSIRRVGFNRIIPTCIKKNKHYNKMKSILMKISSYKYRTLSCPYILKRINHIYFEEDIIKTEKIIKRDLSYWL